MNLDLAGKTALVCGGSKGLGFGSAQQLAELGARIILLARSEKILQQKTSELNIINQLENEYVVADMNELDSLVPALDSRREQSAIHILINNTGGPPGGTLIEAEEAALEKGFRMHILASQIITKYCIPGMRLSEYGRIINIVSTSIRQPIPGLGVSNTIRGAMGSWSKTLALELAPEGITVNNILPGTTKTERLDDILASRQQLYGYSEEEATNSMLTEIPMGRFAEVAEIAQVVAFIASPAAAYITGTNIPVDGCKIRSI